MTFEDYQNEAVFQFTHPRGVRPCQASPRRRFRRVSIHAPARGATVADTFLDCGALVSIHAPARGATIKGVEKYIRLLVSIHAPARGATSSNFVDIASSAGFNSRTREGCDKGGTRAQKTLGSFNSRTREGCDYIRGRKFAAVVRFNSRTREGCDWIYCYCWCCISVSIHAPARGATPCFCGRRLRTRCFNSRTREGCDISNFNPRAEETKVSIHAPARGATAPQ